MDEPRLDEIICLFCDCTCLGEKTYFEHVFYNHLAANTDSENIHTYCWCGFTTTFGSYHQSCKFMLMHFIEKGGVDLHYLTWKLGVSNER